MANIYDIRRYGTFAFMAVAILLAACFLAVSNSIVGDLASQERQRMELWAEATKSIIGTSAEDVGNEAQSQQYINFLLHIIEDNRSIPVILADDKGNIILHRNFDLPEPLDSLNPLYISERNAEFLSKKLKSLASQKQNIIPIEIGDGITQHLYYQDSRLLQRLNYFPYVQMLIMVVFVSVVYFAVMSTKKAEQNKVWVGLSKETAHQLGTPISSLMAWMELLEQMDVGAEVVEEMNKDVVRLSTIASRFGKIGSKPKMETTDADVVVQSAVSYMKTRISQRIKLVYVLPPAVELPLKAQLSDSLFQWVLENLIKNAVDAMDADGAITVVAGRDERAGRIFIEVTDTGKGLPKKRFKTIFKPGYTTKKRGWGLGLALAKRIVEQYHGGRIFVKWSEPDRGTTFRIELPSL
ncbi:HAMP domain-containing sensor histidine kinase [uncultured Muribaculum sp.]|uniref:sensor histidine kinase n=2 Tax=uncultured Muribaculum sp. TaxID=1918613 RepID=UPI0025B798B8|nr:HAMP domain-containing sensor histidine kinase [uncultured Muribaculum sp.]